MFKCLHEKVGQKRKNYVLGVEESKEEDGEMF